jgi:signal peptidase I
MIAAMRVLLLAVASFFFPGTAEGAADRPRAVALWGAVHAAVIAACAWSVWALPLVFAVRFSAVTAAVRVTRGRARSNVPLALAAVGLNAVILVGARLAVVEAFKSPSTSMAPTIALGDHLMAEKVTPRFGVGRGDVVVFRHPCGPEDYLKRVAAIAGDTIEVRCDVVYVNGAALPATLVQGEGCMYDDRDPDGRWRETPCSEYAEVQAGHRYHIYASPGRAARRSDAPAPHDFPALRDPPVPPSCAADGGGRARANQQPGAIVAKRTGDGACAPQRQYVVPPGHVFMLGDNRDNSNDSRTWGAVPVEDIRGKVTGIWFSANRGGALAKFGGVE